MICWRCHSNRVNTGSRLPICSDVKTRKRRNVVDLTWFETYWFASWSPGSELDLNINSYIEAVVEKNVHYWESSKCKYRREYYFVLDISSDRGNGCPSTGMKNNQTVCFNDVFCMTLFVMFPHENKKNAYSAILPNAT
jgi:hypothetical protein